jgi:hypothetical protein
MNKKQMADECVKLFTRKQVQEWYAKNLEGKDQGDTLDTLETVLVATPELTIREALAIMWVVGVEWKEKFEGTP